MNIDDYITSGILQNYCFGLLTKEEERKVEKICTDYPKVARELQLFRNALKEYSSHTKILNREELRRATWESIKKIWEEEST